jgi:hypothetical protein
MDLAAADYGRATGTGAGGGTCGKCAEWNPSSKRLGLCADRALRGYSATVWTRRNDRCGRFTTRATKQRR